MKKLEEVMTDAELKEKQSSKYKMTHDKLFKRCMADTTVASEFIESYLPKEVLDVINLSTLKLEKSDFADAVLGNGVSDVLYSVKWKERTGYISLLLEHQSQSDKLMALRIMKYILKICDLYISQNNGKELPLPPIVPLIIYTGKTSYTATRSFYDLFEEPEMIKKFCPEPKVLILKDIKDLNVREKIHSGVVLSLMQKIHKQDILPDLEFLMPFLQIVMRTNLHIGENLLKYVLDNAECKDDEQVMQLFVDVTPQEYRGHMRTIGDQIRERGKIEGKIEKSQEIAMKMLKKQMSISDISSITELSFAEIEEIKRDSLRAKSH